jgi:hypothetical protein
MTNSSSDLPKAGAADKELALWMLERMRLSEETLGVIRAARSAGGTDVLDTPGYVAQHTKRLAPLFQGADEEVIDAPISMVALIEKLAERDLLSSPEEFIEKALAAYIAKHPKGDTDLPPNWQSTVDAARAEVEGRTSGAFRPDFTAELATAARAEIARRNGLEKGSARDRSDDRGS